MNPAQRKEAKAYFLRKMNLENELRVKLDVH